MPGLFNINPLRLLTWLLNVHRVGLIFQIVAHAFHLLCLTMELRFSLDFLFAHDCRFAFSSCLLFVVACSLVVHPL